MRELKGFFRNIKIQLANEAQKTKTKNLKVVLIIFHIPCISLGLAIKLNIDISKLAYPWAGQRELSFEFCGIHPWM